MRITKDLAVMRLLREAYKVAAQSPDPSTQNAALLVKSGQIVLSACNDFPPRVLNKPDRLYDRPEKYRFIEHAERAVLYKAIRDGFNLENKIMVCPWAACADCARAIVACGLQLLYVHKEAMEHNADRWSMSVEAGATILEEGGVSVVYYEGKIGGGVAVRRNGAIWEP